MILEKASGKARHSAEVRLDRLSAANRDEKFARRLGTIGRRPSSHLMRLIAIQKWALVLGVLLLGVDAAGAQMVIDPDRAPHALPDRPHPTLPDFSMQQRASIYRSVVASTREHHTVPVPSDRQIVVGTVLLDPAQLEPAPEDVRTQIPASSNYKYAVWKAKCCWSSRISKRWLISSATLSCGTTINSDDQAARHS